MKDQKLKIVIRCAGQVLTKRKNVVTLTEEVLSSLTTNNDGIHDDSLMLLDAMGELKDNHRTTLILFYYYDYSIKTISEMMEIPEGSVKNEP